MPKKAGVVIVILGAVLILSALLLLAYNRADDERAGQEAESLLLRAQSEIDRNPVSERNTDGNADARSRRASCAERKRRSGE